MKLGELIENSGGRKFALAIIAALGATTLVAVGRIDGATYQVVVLGALGLFGTANVAQKVAAGRASAGGPT